MCVCQDSMQPTSSVPSTDGLRRRDAALVLQAPESELGLLTLPKVCGIFRRCLWREVALARKAGSDPEIKQADCAEQMARSLVEFQLRGVVPGQIHRAPGHQIVRDQYRVPVCGRAKMEGNLVKLMWWRWA